MGSVPTELGSNTEPSKEREAWQTNSKKVAEILNKGEKDADKLSDEEYEIYKKYKKGLQQP